MSATGTNTSGPTVIGVSVSDARSTCFSYDRIAEPWTFASANTSGRTTNVTFASGSRSSTEQLGG